MAHAAGDALDFPIYGSHFCIVEKIPDADGDPVTGATTPDSEISIDLGTFADCTNEMVELATASGFYYLYLTGAEMTGKIIAVQLKCATAGAKTPLRVLYPKRLPIFETGTAQAGAAGTITLAQTAYAFDSFYNGMFVRCSNNSPAGVQYATRRILSYVGSTRVATVESNWGTNPSSATTYEILVAETVNVSALVGKVAAIDTYALDAVLAFNAAVLAGKISGAGEGVETFRNLADTANRVVSTTDRLGNRTAVTLTAP